MTSSFDANYEINVHQKKCHILQNLIFCIPCYKNALFFSIAPFSHLLFCRHTQTCVQILKIIHFESNRTQTSIMDLICVCPPVCLLLIISANFLIRENGIIWLKKWFHGRKYMLQCILDQNLIATDCHIFVAQILQSNYSNNLAFHRLSLTGVN